MKAALFAAIGAAPARADFVRLTLLSAKIDPALVVPAGRAHSTASLSDLSCQSLPGLRKVSALCGGAARPEGLAAVDPILAIELASRSIRTYPIPGTLSPEWSYSVVIDPDDTDDTEAPRVVLFDHGDRKDTRLGSKTIKFKELFALGPHKLAGVGGKSEVAWRVDAIDKNGASRSAELHVPADRQMIDLAREADDTTKITGISAGGGAKGRYLLVPVAEGETVEVSAGGQVQPSAIKHPKLTTGPEGLPTIQSKIQNNQPGFRGCPGCDHAALIAQLGTEGMVIGEKKTFTAKSSGLLIFGINDVRVADNAGGYDVKVSVRTPRSQGVAPDARVVEMAFDSHLPEIEACEAEHGSPTGHLALDFMISADGRPVGVVMSHVSPQMKEVADCVQKKTLNWTFPLAAAGAIGSYPLTFSESAAE